MAPLISLKDTLENMVELPNIHELAIQNGKYVPFCLFSDSMKLHNVIDRENTKPNKTVNSLL